MSDALLPIVSRAKSLRATVTPIPSKGVSRIPVQAGIIPVGHEPRRHPCPSQHTAAGREIAKSDEGFKPAPRAKGAGNLRNPKKFFGLKDRFNALRIITMETMGTLRKSEIQVWLAIFNCEFKGLAQIGYSRLCEVTKLSRRHVGKAVASLESKGLLEVVVRGRYRPSRNAAGGGGRAGSGAGEGRSSEAGLASIYRVFPRQHRHAKQEAATPLQQEPTPR